MKILRKILAVIAGIVVATIVMMTIESVGHQLYGAVPFDSDYEAKRAFVAKLPLPAFLLVLLSHGAGSFTASAVATLVAGHRWLAGAIGLGIFYLLAGIAMLIMIPHPIWFAVVDLLLYIPAALAGCYATGAMFSAKPQTTA